MNTNVNTFIVDKEATDIINALNDVSESSSKTYRDGIFLIEENGDGEIILRDICFDVDRNFLFSLTVPDTVTVIGDNCFRDCSVLEKIFITPNVVRIEEGAFRNCTSLHSIIIPDSVTSIGSYCFYGCENLESIKLSYSLTKLDACTFGNCRSLEYLYLPESIIDISSSCFRHCESLRSLAIANSKLNPDENWFKDCVYLNTLIVHQGSFADTFCFENDYIAQYFGY